MKQRRRRGGKESGEEPGACAPTLGRGAVWGFGSTAGNSRVLQQGGCDHGPWRKRPRARVSRRVATVGFEPASLCPNPLAPGSPHSFLLSTQGPLLWRPSRLPQGVPSGCPDSTHHAQLEAARRSAPTGRGAGFPLAGSPPWQQPGSPPVSCGVTSKWQSLSLRLRSRGEAGGQKRLPCGRGAGRPRQALRPMVRSKTTLYPQ